MPSCGLGMGNIILPSDPSLTGISLSATVVPTGVRLSWSYPSTNPHALAHVEVFRSTNTDYTSAMSIGIGSGNQYFDYLIIQEPIRYYYWIKLISINGTRSEVIGPAVADLIPTSSTWIDVLGPSVTGANLVYELRAKIDQIAVLAESIHQEAADRLADYFILGGAYDSVIDRMDTIDTLIVDEVSSRTTADDALVSSLNFFVAKYDTSIAGFSDKIDVFTARDLSYATRVTTLESQTSTMSARVGYLETVRTTDKDAIYEAIGNIEVGTIDGIARGKISSIESLIADPNSTIYTKVNAVTVKADNTALNLTSEISSRASKDSAIYSAISAASAAIVNPGGSIAAAIASNNEIRLDNPTSGLVSKLDTLRVVVQGPSGTTGIAAEVAEGSYLKTTANKVTAAKFIKLDVDGRVAGIGILNDTSEGSQIELRADRIRMGQPGYSGVYPFEIAPVNGVYQVAMKKAMIQDLSVDTLKIGNNAVTVPAGSSGASYASPGVGYFNNVHSLGVYLDHPAGTYANVLVIGTVGFLYASGSGESIHEIAIMYAGNPYGNILVSSPHGYKFAATVAFQFTGVSPGYYTIYIGAKRHGGGGTYQASNATLAAIGTKK